MSNWTYLFISRGLVKDPWPDQASFLFTLRSFANSLQSVGIAVAQGPTGGKRIEVNLSNLEANIDQALQDFCRTPKRPELVLIILPDKDTAIYNRVKHGCDVMGGLINICVQAQHFKNQGAQYHANVALKVNLKLGGCNHRLDEAKLGLLANNKTMIVGIDVTHPSPGSSSNAPSVAGIVASVDKEFGQWPAELRVQTQGQEMVAELGGMLKNRLRLWQERNQMHLPDNILVYRDGVSEGQYQLVRDRELLKLQEACREIYPASSTAARLPRITIVVVGKRHNTRFYPTTKETADRSMNPQNGTVVDRGVTEMWNWDFFLQAHTAIKGTARPAHYYVVHDDMFTSSKPSAPNQNPSDTLQTLTHNLCYLFGRATKAVSICPPAYYADLVCERARCYLAGVFDPSLSSSGSATGASSQAGTSGSIALTPSISIHPNVRNRMFYI